MQLNAPLYLSNKTQINKQINKTKNKQNEEKLNVWELKKDIANEFYDNSILKLEKKWTKMDVQFRYCEDTKLHSM